MKLRNRIPNDLFENVAFRLPGRFFNHKRRRRSLNESVQFRFGTKVSTSFLGLPKQLFQLDHLLVRDISSRQASTSCCMRDLTSFLQRELSLQTFT